MLSKTYSKSAYHICIPSIFFIFIELAHTNWYWNKALLHSQSFNVVYNHTRHVFAIKIIQKKSTIDSINAD